MEKLHLIWFYFPKIVTNTKRQQVENRWCVFQTGQGNQLEASEKSDLSFGNRKEQLVLVPRENHASYKNELNKTQIVSEELDRGNTYRNHE